MTPSIDIFMFVDALGWELARSRNVLADLLPHRDRCDTLFGYSCTCDPSILTGALPQEHGHFSFYAYAPEASPFRWAQWLGWLPRRIAGYHRLRNRLSRLVAKRLGYTGYFQLYSAPFSRLPCFDYTEKKDLYEPGGILGGQETIFELWKRSGVPWARSDWRADDATNLRTLGAQLDEGRIRLAYVFNAGLDGTMHAHGTTGHAVDAAFARLETAVRELDHRARHRYREVRWHLFSDHGMADTRSTSTMMDDCESLGLRFGRDYAAAWDSTMARFWFPGGDAPRKRIEAWLATRKEGRIVSKNELQRWGCWFPDGRYGELFYVLDEGVIFAPSFMNLGLVKGMHGFDPDLPNSAACWLTSHPVDHKPARIEQIHRVMSDACRRIAASPGH